MDLTTTEQDTAGSPTGSANLPVGDPAADDSAADDSAADDPAVGEVLGWPVGEAGDALVENVEVTVRLLPPFMSSGQDDPVSVRNRFALLDPAVRSSPSVRLGLAHALAELGWHQQALEQLDAVLEGSQVGPNLPELSKEIVLGVEALHHELQGEGEKALELRQTLATFFPDDFEHGLRLAQAERRFGDPLRAEAILNRLGTDLQQPVLHMRIELERAEVWHARSESEQMLAAAERAAEAARLEDRPYRLAQALLLSGRARHHQKAATEAVADLAAAADLFERLHVARGAAEAQVVWATLLYEQERFDGAREIAEKSLAASVKLEDPVRIARARLQLGRIEIAVGDLDRAIEEITAAMSAYEQAGLEIGASSARTSLAHLRYRQGRLDVAMDLLKSSLDVYRRRKRWENIASSASNLGMVAIEMGRWQDAERSLAEAAEARRQGDMGEGSAYIRLSSARIALNRGELDPAMELALAALEEFRRQGRPSGQLAAHKMLARVDEVSGDLHAAERRLNEAATLPFFSPIAPVDGADARRRFTLALSRARVAMYRGSASQVEKQLELADRLLPQITEPKLKALFLQTRGRWLWWSGEPETGRQAMTEALQEWRTSGRAAMENRACLDLARLALDTGRLDSAEQQIRSVLERSRDLGDDPSAALAWALRAELELQRGKLEVAQTYARISRETAPLTAHDEGRLVLVSAILDPSAEQGADADREIQGILERAEQGGDCRLAVAALGASARLAKKNGQPEKATDKRKQATDRAATCGYGEPSKG